MGGLLGRTLNSANEYAVALSSGGQPACAYGGPGSGVGEEFEATVVVGYGDGAWAHFKIRDEWLSETTGAALLPATGVILYAYVSSGHGGALYTGPDSDTSYANTILMEGAQLAVFDGWPAPSV